MKRKTSISDDTNYVKVCKKMSEHDIFFTNFKQNPTYNEILEHVSQSQGQEYLDIIENEYSFLLDNIEKFKENDKFGYPKTFSYENIGIISPTTLRYIKVLGDLIKYELVKDDIDIVEIGGGYGGQSKIILDHFNVKKYSIIDLESPLALTEKYLNLFENINKYEFIDAYEYVKKDTDLLISNYAFSECNKESQDEYITKLINNSKHGYMTINYLNDSVYTIEEMIDKIDKDIKIFDETPNTYKLNKLIIW